MRKSNFKAMQIGNLFKVQSGDFHAYNELDAGDVPLISCGDTNNGFIGNFDIPKERTYSNCITVAYNGSWPLMAKFHPYRFAAKDDVAVLIPKSPMRETTLLFVATLLTKPLCTESAEVALRTESPTPR